MPNTRVGLYSKARNRATSKLQERSPSNRSSNLEAPSPRDARLQARAAAAAQVLRSQEAIPEEGTHDADNDAISDDALSTDPTNRTIDYGDNSLVDATGTAVANGDDDNGNEDIEGVNDQGKEGDDIDDYKEGNNEGEHDTNHVDNGEDGDKGEDEDEAKADAEGEGDGDDEDDDDNEDGDDDDDEDNDDDEDDEDDEDEDEDNDDDEEDDDDDSQDVDYVDYQTSDNEDHNLYNGMLYHDDDDGDLDSLEGGKYRVPSVRGKRGGRKANPNRPPRPNTDGMSAEEAKEALDHWDKDWRRTKDRARRALAHQVNKGEGSLDESKAYTGVCDVTIRLMTEVELHPLELGHTFPTKDICLMRIAEEANLWGVRILMKRSDTHQIRAVGLLDSFDVVAYYSDRLLEWKITKCDIQHPKVNGQPSVPPLTYDDLPNNASDVLNIEVGDADGDPTPMNTTPTNATPKQRPRGTPLPMSSKGNKRVRSPLRSKWLIPILRAEVSLRPNMSNKDMQALCKDYVKPMFLTKSLLNSTRLAIRKEAFGDPDTNVMFAPALANSLKVAGHDVEIYLRNKSQVMAKCEEMALTQFVSKCRLEGHKLLRKDKIEYVKEWKLDNEDMLVKAGLGNDGSDTLKFVSGLFLSLKQARHTVPLLQSVFQADAAHMNFGKYTLYSCYGTTANGNTFPVAIAIIFGNEDKDGWMRFWKFVKNIHPSIHDPRNTIITDQQKGSIPALNEVLPGVVNFFCSFHRRQNITKYVKGGSGPYSCLWFYNLLINAKLPQTIDRHKFDHSNDMQVQALRFLNSVNDYQQYPAARCALHEHACMHKRTASSSVEAMNHANESVRDRSAVDPINALILLLHLEDKRYKGHVEAAWGRDHELTPYGSNLIGEAFKKVSLRDYSITVHQMDGDHICRVQRVVSTNQYTCVIPMIEHEDSYFGSCTCGVPKVDGVPCVHMIAVVKSNRIEGLNESNIMPYWYHTSHWRKQYPEGSNVCAGNITLSILRETHRPAKDYKLCPGISAPRKGGRPKKLLRLKSAIEVALDNKKKKGAKGKGKKGNVKGTPTKQKEKKKGGGMAKVKGKGKGNGKGKAIGTPTKLKGSAKGNKKESPPSLKTSEPRGKKLRTLVATKASKTAYPKTKTAKTSKSALMTKASPKKVVAKKKKAMTHEEDGNRTSKRVKK